ncbi:DNA primase large subunit-like [Macrosteles quadrilineatus]|uniref:DNA primase large subunit-like n=1 Tax=Macrosteles quadrilineatus TaxID=74068 RepID=UPI0023E2F9C3|nr:DNA primase large subunit-like [Macrosteles quadrilineatus]
MDFSRRRVVLTPEQGALAELYPHDLQMYIVPPINDISLSEFQELAVSRLTVLRIIEQVSSRGLAKNSDEWKKAVADEIKKHPGLKFFHKLITSHGTSKEPDYSARKADHISHFVLRLAFCRTEELKRWFISRELDLFKLRWLNLSNEGKAEFIRINNLNYKPIPSEDLSQIVEMSYGVISSSLDYYKVSFTTVLDLVRSRKVFLHLGYAYITNNEIISVILTMVRNRLSNELSRTARLLPSMEATGEDQDRIFRYLKSLPHAYIGEDYSTRKSGDKVPIECIDSLARQSFPLCMRQLHYRLRQDHKLRHHGRLQYAMFLKGIGVTLEDITTMWREEWAKVEPEKFEKGGVAYLLRHSYGKEGKRTNYTPHSCMKIINASVTTGDQHGCPFKHNDVSTIRLQLNQSNVPAADVQETVDLINRGHYQLACTKYFELTHGQPPERLINHPNQYFEDSQNVKSGKAGVRKKEITAITATPVAATSSKSDGQQDVWGDLADDDLMSVDMQ